MFADHPGHGHEDSAGDCSDDVSDGVVLVQSPRIADVCQRPETKADRPLRFATVR